MFQQKLNSNLLTQAEQCKRLLLPSLQSAANYQIKFNTLCLSFFSEEVNDITFTMFKCVQNKYHEYLNVFLTQYYQLHQALHAETISYLTTAEIKRDAYKILYYFSHYLETAFSEKFLIQLLKQVLMDGCINWDSFSFITLPFPVEDDDIDTELKFFSFPDIDSFMTNPGSASTSLINFLNPILKRSKTISNLADLKCSAEFNHSSTNENLHTQKQTQLKLTRKQRFSFYIEHELKQSTCSEQYSYDTPLN